MITDGTEIYGLAPDSSMVHAGNPAYDGQRFLTACSREHLAALREQYQSRPFIEEELWAGKIGRALEFLPHRPSIQELAQATGLNVQQIGRALAWLEE
ncbi:hypothetical protein ACQEVF_57045 [Nonomuraea polychroma]|uniref:hypothetical protein n=1 Tax=Nonomuraea polychroma TaxID=46176 RepID=UPI003D930BC0